VIRTREARLKLIKTDSSLNESRSEASDAAVSHGGAWAVGYKSERLMPIVANEFAVASADYPLARSVTYPAPVHDVKAGVRWLRANAPSTG
jgi:hypothetical protein